VTKVVIHGHFYQPPRENPWTGLVDQEESAAPEHDWNVRVSKECYQPLVAIAVEDGGQKVEIPAYEFLSFDFGATLLDWMEREMPALHDTVIDADRASVRRLAGHGNALAMPFHHIILPLASRRDKVTEVRWGIRDFKKRFGRDPVGLWLPETAVDYETLEVIAGEGIAFTVLAPHQVRKVPERGLPGRIRLAGGREIAVFAYDGGLSHDLAFGGLLSDADRWTGLLKDRADGTITAMAMDGETFGHHHGGGDKALGLVIHRLRDRITNFAAAFAEHQAQETVELVESTSWSCSHGVERWRSACGCRIEHNAQTQQDWRGPLRAAIDWLASEAHGIYEREGATLPGGPWEFRDGAGAIEPVDGGEAAERLIEMERSALRSMTSCGWFFDDVAGLESRQALRYAAHAISLAGEEGPRLEAGFIEKLGDARSNDPNAGSAADVFRQVAQQAGAAKS
jgi:alpha-amylase/alpha-mannosidase (GH57 family)